MNNHKEIFIKMNNKQIRTKIYESIKPLIKQKIMEQLSENAVDTAMKKTETGPMERGLEILRNKVKLITSPAQKAEFIVSIMPKLGIDEETLAVLANRIKTGAKQAAPAGAAGAAGDSAVANELS